VPTPLEGLLKLGESRAPGPSPSFDRAHMLLVFLTIGSSGVIGRSALSRRAGLGEGAIRTVLKKLRSSGYVEAGASGCSLTKAGTGAYGSLKKRISGPLRLKGSRLTVGRSQSALAIRGGGHLIRGGIEQRDAAVRAGALGATTYVVAKGRFAMPGGSADSEGDFPDPVWKEIRGGLSPKDGDAVILCGASDDLSAELGALAVGLALL